MEWKLTAAQATIAAVGMLIAWLVGLGAGAKIAQMNQEQDKERETAGR